MAAALSPDGNPGPRLRGMEQVLQADEYRRVVRIDDTVRRPVMPWSTAVHELLLRLEHVGFSAAPRFLGLDEHGREVLSYLDGVSGNDGFVEGVEHGAEVWANVADEDGLRSFAQLLRRFHDATGGTWCHGDYTPWNVVWTGRQAVGIIDWDHATAGPPMDDVAYALRWCIPFADDDECLRWRRFAAPPDRRRRLAIFAEAYGLPGSEGLFDAAVDRQRRTIRQVRQLAERGIQPQADWVAKGATQVDEAVIAWSLDHRELFEN